MGAVGFCHGDVSTKIVFRKNCLKVDPLEEKEVEDTSDDESDVERVVSKTISNKTKSKKYANQLCVKYVKDGKVHGDGASFYLGTGNGAEAQTRAAAAKLS
jgi:hypothetical protein